MSQFSHGLALEPTADNAFHLLTTNGFTAPSVGGGFLRLGVLAHSKNTKGKIMKQTIQTLKFGLAAVLFAMTSSALLATPPNTGIKGQAVLYISYGTPIEEEPGVWIGVGDVQLPVAASFSIFTAPSGHKLGHLVGHFTTDAAGAFTVLLLPSKYIIVPDALTAPFGESVPTGAFEVTVRAKKFAPTQILYYQDGPLSIFPTQTP